MESPREGLVRAACEGVVPPLCLPRRKSTLTVQTARHARRQELVSPSCEGPVTVCHVYIIVCTTVPYVTVCTRVPYTSQCVRACHIYITVCTGPRSSRLKPLGVTARTSDFELLRRVGMGVFSSVWLCRHTASYQLLAAKVRRTERGWREGGLCNAVGSADAVTIMMAVPMIAMMVTIVIRQYEGSSDDHDNHVVMSIAVNMTC